MNKDKWYEQVTQQQLYEILQICASREDEHKKNLVRLLVNLLELQDAQLHAPPTGTKATTLTMTAKLDQDMDAIHEQLMEKFKENFDEDRKIVNRTWTVPPPWYARKP